MLTLAIHIDDCAMTGNNQGLINEHCKCLNHRYQLTHFGPIRWLLGIKVNHDFVTHTIALSQVNYINTLLKRFGLVDANATLVPMDPSASYFRNQCSTNSQEIARMRRIPYREIISSLMYISIATRPDISFTVSTLSQFLDNPGKIHWEATKYSFLIDDSAISWSLCKQELITLSTAESEYVAATHTAKEAIWLRCFIIKVFRPVDKPTRLYSDNQSAIAMATNSNYYACTKYIDIRYHFIRFVTEDGTIELVYCPIDDMAVDTLTQALALTKARHFATALRLCIT
ncbi:hypothetical protein NM688_g60 [Phlebia brevispora]|uniref:Uncharacterized protein n=1 Tax=Phlebia brevispora TaxID=194682 RepID=A0ACC1TG62_9APHY|nr:hypothetical protein NM688_g60 [Phlebia brevispora]